MVTKTGNTAAFQEYLFPTIEADLGRERYQAFITVLEFVRVEQHLPGGRNWRGRPLQDRAALARAFIAKAVFQIDRALRERLTNDPALRRLCGWESMIGRSRVPLPGSPRAAEALIKNTCRIVGQSRDAAIEGREKPTPKPKQPAKPKRKRGRPRRGTALRQQAMTLPEDLPQACDGHQTQRQGRNATLIDADDGGIPLSCILTSASVNDSQVANWPP